MNARREDADRLTAIATDPFASLCSDAAAVADLAFGSLSADATQLAGGHLSILPPDALALDLDDPTQRRLGNYELLELIGEGGMGVVYRARQQGLDRDVAIKLLAAGPWASSDFIERFRREAQHAARMQHPNIVAIYEVDSAEQLHFFSMQLIRGESLALLLKREGRLPARRAAELLRTVAEAVDYAHSLGVLHLDLKPGNVLIDGNGVPHVADFGLARRLDQSAAADHDEVSGTPSYMAPEQASGRADRIATATDIWGLGAILYELVTGVPPFLDQTPQATLRQVVNGRLRNPRSIVPDLQRDLDAIIMRCMARETSARYASARELADDLARFLENHPVHARPLSGAQRAWRWARRQPVLAMLAGAFVASLLVGVIGTGTQWRRAEHNAAVSSERLWESRRDTAQRAQMDGRGYAAMPRLIANVEEQERSGRTELAHIDRRELGMIKHHGVALIRRLHLGNANAHPFAVGASPDGSRVAIAFTDLTVHWYDTADMRERGHVDLLGLPVSTGAPEMPVLVQFIDNRRFRVTLEWPEFEPAPSQHDAYLVDTERGGIVRFPDRFAALANATIGADGRFALLQNHHGEVQLWQTDPWQRVMTTPGGSTPVTLPPMSQTNALFLGSGARFIAVVGNVTTTLDLIAGSNQPSSERVALPPTKGLSAWAGSSDGSKFALGDIDGRIFIVDVATRRVRRFPTPRGREIRWVAFSEDDAWLAAARADGAAYAFDVASGDPLISGQIQHDFELRRVAISHRHRLLVASGFGRTGVWRLPPPGPIAADAVRLSASPMSSADTGPYALGFAHESGLLVTASLDGDVRLWRVPPSPVRRARAAPQLAGALRFDGRRLPDVEYRSVRVVSADGGSATPWLEFPATVDFAALAGSGETLVAVAGRQLYVIDSATAKPRHDPTQLEANALRLAVTDDGTAAVLSFGGMGTGGFEERLVSYDLATGNRMAGPVAIRGPLRQLEISPDGSRLVATGPPDGRTEVFDARTLRPLDSRSNDVLAPTMWAAFMPPRNDRLMIATHADASRRANDALIIWDPDKDAAEETIALGRTWPLAAITAGATPFVAGHNQDILAPGSAHERIVERVARTPATAALAASSDGRLVAHAFAREVQLFETTRGAAVGPPLHADINGMDMIAQLAFDPGGNQLLGRTLLGHWLLWPIAPDTRPVAALRRDADVLNEAAGASTQSATGRDGASPSRYDPGPWREAEARPVAEAVRYVGGTAIPKRPTAAGLDQLDLTDFYDRAPGSLANPMINFIPAMRVLPTGLVHLDGVDYDVRGATWLHDVRPFGDGASKPRSKMTGVPIPAVPVTAFRILVMAPSLLPKIGNWQYATLRMHYADGSIERVPLRTGPDRSSGAAPGAFVPKVWAWGDQNRLTGYAHQKLVSAARIANPHPARLIDRIDIDANEEASWLTGLGANPTIFAITLERAKSAQDSGAAAAKIRAGSRNPATKRTHDGRSP